MKIICPDCEVENPGYQSTCWHCGKDFTGAERTDNSGLSSSSLGTAELVVVKAAAAPTSQQSTANLTLKNPSIHPTVEPPSGEWKECPICKADNSKYQLNCWHCGESLIGVAGGATEPAEKNPAPAIDIWERITLPSDKPVARLQPVFSIGIFFLIILGASIIFQVLQLVSRILFIAGFVSGFGFIYIKTVNPSSTNSDNASDLSKSPIPKWLALPIVLIFLLFLVIIIFGWDYVIEYLFSQDPNERFFAIVLGIVFGGIIEFALDYLLQVMAQWRSK